MLVDGIRRWNSCRDVVYQRRAWWHYRLSIVIQRWWCSGHPSTASIPFVVFYVVVHPCHERLTEGIPIKVSPIVAAMHLVTTATYTYIRWLCFWNKFELNAVTNQFQFNWFRLSSPRVRPVSSSSLLCIAWIDWRLTVKIQASSRAWIKSILIGETK